MTRPSDRAIAQAFLEYAEATVALPRGDEDRQRGSSVYNWRRGVEADVLRRAFEIDAAAPEGAQAVAMYQVRPRLGDGSWGAWREVSKRYFDDYDDNETGYPPDRWERRKLYTALPSQDAEDAAAKFGAFAVEILNLDEDWIGDVDGGSLQDAAVKHGLLKPVEVTEACGEGCSCAAYGDFPQECFKPTAIMRAAIDAARAAEGDGR